MAYPSVRGDFSYSTPKPKPKPKAPVYKPPVYQPPPAQSTNYSGGGYTSPKSQTIDNDWAMYQQQAAAAKAAAAAVQAEQNRQAAAARQAVIAAALAEQNRQAAAKAAAAALAEQQRLAAEREVKRVAGVNQMIDSRQAAKKVLAAPMPKSKSGQQFSSPTYTGTTGGPSNPQPGGWKPMELPGPVPKPVPSKSQAQQALLESNPGAYYSRAGMMPINFPSLNYKDFENTPQVPYDHGGKPGRPANYATAKDDPRIREALMRARQPDNYAAYLDQLYPNYKAEMDAANEIRVNPTVLSFASLMSNYFSGGWENPYMEPHDDNKVVPTSDTPTANVPWLQPRTSPAKVQGNPWDQNLPVVKPFTDRGQINPLDYRYAMQANANMAPGSFAPGAVPQSESAPSFSAMYQDYVKNGGIESYNTYGPAYRKINTAKADVERAAAIELDPVNVERAAVYGMSVKDYMRFVWDTDNPNSKRGPETIYKNGQLWGDPMNADWHYYRNVANSQNKIQMEGWDKIPNQTRFPGAGPAGPSQVLNENPYADLPGGWAVTPGETPYVDPGDGGDGGGGGGGGGGYATSEYKGGYNTGYNGPGKYQKTPGGYDTRYYQSNSQGGYVGGYDTGYGGGGYGGGGGGGGGYNDYYNGVNGGIAAGNAGYLSNQYGQNRNDYWSQLARWVI